DPADVGGEHRRRVTTWRLVRAAEAAQVHRRDPVAGLGQGRQLMAPGPPELGEAVEQEDELTGLRAREDDVEAGTVRRDEPVFPRSVLPHHALSTSHGGSVDGPPSPPTPPHARS